ncbi:hypothetical protein R1T16_14950 [Flavobacterium sp. DG1-102-2]|uniref:hypothetical protein n=1 Tax=Flavobacterium sp. DG1-102-2 TaxID=3081663 RepID=UPI0029490F9A|nr:hypothetical protein [Flavobacterium sp. DG1-102-2]MDV6169733.1 hypothetical protein [Flavobacterium sp. DG1-102-2]
MKNKIIAFAALSIMLTACNSKETRLEQRSEPADPVTTEAKPAIPVVAGGTFDITAIPVSEADLGDFPFVKLPKDYCFGYCSSWSGKPNEKDIKDTDKEYFAVNGKLIPVEGKTYKVTIEKNRDADNKRFSRLAVLNSLDKDIKALGGVQVNNVPVSNEEWKRVGDEELIKNGYGKSIDVNLLDDIKTYIIRTKDKEVWIQFNLMDEESGRIAVLEKAGF